jgi:hypothetical protein
VQYLKLIFAPYSDQFRSALKSEKLKEDPKTLNISDLCVVERWCVLIIRDIPEVTAEFMQGLQFSRFFSEQLGFSSEIKKTTKK